MIKDQILLAQAKERRNKGGESGCTTAFIDVTLGDSLDACGDASNRTHRTQPSPETPSIKTYVIIEDCAKLPPYLTIALDTETTGLERNAKLLGISFCGEVGKAFWLPVDKIVPFVMEATLAGKQLIMHNAKFDIQVLARNVLLI